MDLVVNIELRLGYLTSKKISVRSKSRRVKCYAERDEEDRSRPVSLSNSIEGRPVPAAAPLKNEKRRGTGITNRTRTA